MDYSVSEGKAGGFGREEKKAGRSRRIGEVNEGQTEA